MFTLTRLSTVPSSPLKVVVSQPDGDDAGLTVGGSFYFQPAGDAHGDDTAGMSEYAARAIMGDPGLAVHFRCEPPLPAPAATPALDADRQPARRRSVATEAPVEPQA
jgi:hypothetical protein